MPRVCEICGDAEASDEEPQVTDEIELLYVCDRCRRERAPEEGL